MEWNLSDNRPIWLQLKEQIAHGIVTGTYPTGARLPSVRELAADAGVNPNTMQRALSELERDGLCRSVGTMGRMVTEDTEKIDALRRTIAKDVVQQYIIGMARLGYTYADAIRELEEYEHE